MGNRHIPVSQRRLNLGDRTQHPGPFTRTRRITTRNLRRSSDINLRWWTARVGLGEVI